MNNQIKLIQIMTISACSGKCIVCPYRHSWHYKNPGYMNDKSFLHVLDELKSFLGEDYSNKICPYLMNDPFMDKKIVERVETIFQYFPKCYVELSTNGIPLSSDISEKIINVLLKHDKTNRSMIFFSFFGKDKKTWEFLTGKEKYDIALKNMVNYLKINNSRIKTFINTVSGMSIDGSMYFYSKEEWLQTINKILTFYNIPIKNMNIRYYPFHNRAGKVRIGPWDGTEFHRTIDKFNPFDCWRYRAGLHILYNLEILPCCACYDRDEVWGSLKTNTLEEIWNGQKRKDFIDRAIGIKPSDSNFICSKCLHPGG